VRNQVAKTVQYRRSKIASWFDEIADPKKMVDQGVTGA
jgi:phage shock protein A